MLKKALLDPTGGESARRIRELPDEPRPIVDPTAGERARHLRELPQEPQPVVDPTDPRWGTVPQT